MFKMLKMINTLNVTCGIVFEELPTDNGAEFAARAKPDDHPFGQMLLELGIRHRHTRPCRPQTNGKAERFWRTLDDDLIEGTTFDNIHHFENELLEYMAYDNNHRPHQAIGGITPKQCAENLKAKIQSANE
jgi:transposase InsO family protein